MATDFYPGRRLSYVGATCTVRYTGPVKNTKGSWLGVEWNDPSRGKHNGSHDGVKYFDCHSPSPTAGSFLRPARPIEEPVSFLDALRKKYALPEVSASTSETEIHIGGKTVEEVGFAKVAAQLATLHELRVVVLDGLCIGGVLDRPCLSGLELRLQEWLRIEEQKLKLQELDLSRNLIEEWADVVGICSALRSLRTLKLDGNRFRDLSMPKHKRWQDAFSGVKELSLAETFLSWDEILSLLPSFPNLTHLSLASNNLSAPTGPLPTPHLRNLSLAFNALITLSSLSPLTTILHLDTLSLRSNPILTLSSPTPFPTLSTLDLTSTALAAPAVLNHLPQTCPKLRSLLTTHTPLHTTPASHLQTIARVPTLTSLNYCKITPQERTNAELYYLSTIASSLSSTTLTSETAILSEHPRYGTLCELHGAPIIIRKSTDTNATGDEPKPGSLAARLVRFAFYFPDTHGEGGKEITKSLPRTIGIYALKGIIGRLFDLNPMKLKLIWETGERDPIAGPDDSDGLSDDDTDSEEELEISGEENERSGVEPKQPKTGSENKTEKKEGKWVQREEELTDGTKEIAFWIEGKEARVRIEPR